MEINNEQARQKRSRVMSTVRSKNTKLELRFRALLGGRGIVGYDCNADALPGKPDIAFFGERVAVFIDSCFWHGCPRHLRKPCSNTEYWEAKLAYNVRRDARQRRALRQMGWSVFRIWEHDLTKPDAVLARLQTTLSKRRAEQNAKYLPLLNR